ncbi:uncharacterized protein M421DRAFT_355407 [Didymella exigua CBS 183.55]|uniref:Uncharacterized protein n=1 Tax=Didymella exigua CBS 183.55 TaxID=1150837 RepID=A0A6A5R9K4_9PLEO|nr:uncharacterized protein M421DRAFT_355407 [Didymella exigua CBS 183.55]KAF1922517.1 hypothetical protein M421DRAFT_355407 [Didymella exigua CBS 183.55]
MDLVAGTAKRASSDNRKKRTWSGDSETHTHHYKRIRQTTTVPVLQAIIQDIGQTSNEVISLQHPCMCAAATVASIQQKALELAKKRTSTEFASSMNDRIELFCFLSCVVVLRDLNPDASHTLTQVVCETLSLQRDYANRVLAGVLWLHQNLIRRLLELDWNLAEATTIVARYAPATHSKLRHIKSSKQIKVP